MDYSDFDHLHLDHVQERATDCDALTRVITCAATRARKKSPARMCADNIGRDRTGRSSHEQAGRQVTSCIRPHNSSERRPGSQSFRHFVYVRSVRRRQICKASQPGDDGRQRE